MITGSATVGSLTSNRNMHQSDHSLGIWYGTGSVPLVRKAYSCPSTSLPPLTVTPAAVLLVIAADGLWPPAGTLEFAGAVMAVQDPLGGTVYQAQALVMLWLPSASGNVAANFGLGTLILIVVDAQVVPLTCRFVGLPGLASMSAI